MFIKHPILNYPCMCFFNFGNCIAEIPTQIIKYFSELLAFGSKNKTEQSEELSGNVETMVAKISKPVIIFVANEIDGKENAHELLKYVSTFPKHVIDEVTEQFLQDTDAFSKQQKLKTFSDVLM